VIGTPVANRSRVEIEPLIVFLSTAWHCGWTFWKPTVGELYTGQGRTLEAQQRQDLPFEQVVEIVRPPRNLAYARCFSDVRWQNTDQTDLELPG